MNSCDVWKEKIIDGLYGELEGEEKRRLDLHLAECSACQAERQAWLKTMQLWDARKLPAPPPLFWEAFWHRLEQDLKHPGRRLLRNAASRGLSRPAGVALLAAAVAVLVLVGVLRMWEAQNTSRPSSPGHQRAAETERPDSEAVRQAASMLAGREQRLKEQALHHVERSLLVLQSFVNLEVEHLAGEDFPLDENLAQELLQESRLLRAQLEDRDRGLDQLLNQVELFLSALSRVEAAQSEPAKLDELQAQLESSRLIDDLILLEQNPETYF